MPEFKKKTALGLRDLPENGQECTHVLLTHSEYDGLLEKVACAERDAARSIQRHLKRSHKPKEIRRRQKKLLTQKWMRSRKTWKKPAVK